MGSIVFYGSHVCLTDMDTAQLGMSSGRWLMANCGKFPSEQNCKVVMMGPEDQREDLLDAAVAHAVKAHGHTDAPELRTELNKILEPASL